MQRAVTGRVRGRVQGVGFRYSTIRQAESLGVDGWVGNRVDGSVVFFMQGDEALVEAMLEYLANGPRGARVDHLDFSEADPVPDLQGFGLG
jgi:acylphosphatase